MVFPELWNIGLMASGLQILRLGENVGTIFFKGYYLFQCNGPPALVPAWQLILCRG
jgi:hypothetical protein